MRRPQLLPMTSPLRALPSKGCPGSRGGRGRLQAPRIGFDERSEGRRRRASGRSVSTGWSKKPSKWWGLS